jgi:hypothetical protein
VELPAADPRPRRRRGARHGQHAGGQAGRGRLADQPAHRRPGAGGRLPAGVFNVVTGYGGEAGAALSAHPGVDYVTFTGSTGTGTAIQQAAALNNRGVTMELGGKSPQILFADADLDAALPVVVNAIIQNGGQTCSAGSRLLSKNRSMTRSWPRSPAVSRRSSPSRITPTAISAL